MYGRCAPHRAAPLPQTLLLRFVVCFFAWGVVWRPVECHLAWRCTTAWAECFGCSPFIFQFITNLFNGIVIWLYVPLQSLPNDFTLRFPVISSHDMSNSATRMVDASSSFKQFVAAAKKTDFNLPALLLVVWQAGQGWSSLAEFKQLGTFWTLTIWRWDFVETVDARWVACASCRKGKWRSIHRGCAAFVSPCHTWFERCCPNFLVSNPKQICYIHWYTTYTDIHRVCDHCHAP